MKKFILILGIIFFLVGPSTVHPESPPFKAGDQLNKDMAISTAQMEAVREALDASTTKIKKLKP